MKINNKIKRCKRISKIKFIIFILTLISFISFLICFITWIYNKNLLNNISVHINSDTNETLILSDKDLNKVSLKFKIHTKELKEKHETIILQKLEAYKVEKVELEISTNNELTIEEIEYEYSYTTISILFGIISLILFFIPFLGFTSLLFLLKHKFK